MRQGFPQGGILSPTLFNLYMSKMPQPPDVIKLVTYANDSTVLKSGPTIGPICEDLNSYLDTLLNWFKGRNLCSRHLLRNLRNLVHHLQQRNECHPANQD